MVEEVAGRAAGLHARPWPEPVVPTVWILHVERPAVVTGSAQRPGVVDQTAAARYGVDVVRRRSGGGAVLLVPGSSTWVDVLIPAGDRRWETDVGRAFHWLGQAWARALVTAAPTGVHRQPPGASCPVPWVGGGGATALPVVHTGPMVRAEWSGLVCFAGLGAGEVSVAGRKLVGMSQRRTRHGARFQCIVHHRWDPGALVGLLSMPAPEQGRALRQLSGTVATWEGDPHRLVNSFVAALEDEAHGALALRADRSRPIEVRESRDPLP